MDLKEIQNLIKFVAKSGATEVKLEMNDVKITIKTVDDHAKGENAYIQQMPSLATQGGALPPVINNPAPQEDSKSPVEAEDSKYITVNSPIIGTFYRKSSPETPSFVEVGDSIKDGDVLCIIEAMKLFNEIESEITGKIVKVLIDDATPVEFDQPLFLVDPS
jgi:acetyl-CoA carboxylase biotin carboxyl carrier protein